MPYSKSLFINTTGQKTTDKDWPTSYLYSVSAERANISHTSKTICLKAQGMYKFLCLIKDSLVVGVARTFLIGCCSPFSISLSSFSLPLAKCCMSLE